MFKEQIKIKRDVLDDSAYTRLNKDKQNTGMADDNDPSLLA